MLQYNRNMILRYQVTFCTIIPISTSFTPCLTLFCTLSPFVFSLPISPSLLLDYFTDEALDSDCLLTIAADAAINSMAGFLQRQPDPSEFTLVWPKDWAQTTTLDKPQEYRVHVRKRMTMTYMGGFPHHQPSPYPDEPSGDGPSDEHLGGHLSRRGWCFQEGYLPSRVLHFGINHVSWHCATDAFCECEYGPLDKNKKRSRSLAKDKLDRGRIIDRDNLMADWESVVTEYTRRQLSFSSDRLAALAGLAARAHTAKPEVKYLAGLWSDTLPHSLVWDASGSERIRPYVAPSWSWASVTCPVDWPFPERFDTKDRTWLEIIDSSCVPAAPSKYGTLKDARLIVKGVLWPIRLLVADGWGYERMQILGEDCTTSIYDMPDEPGLWDVYDEVSASGETASSCTSSDSTARFNDDEGDGTDQDCDDEADDSVQESHSVGSSSFDSDSLLQADGEFALLNVVGFVWFLVLRRCHDSKGDYTFQRVSRFVRYDGLDSKEQGMGSVRQITLV